MIFLSTSFFKTVVTVEDENTKIFHSRAIVSKSNDQRFHSPKISFCIESVIFVPKTL